MSTPAMPDFRDPEFLLGHIRHTLSFYDGRCLDPTGGFFHFFKDDGTVYDRQTRHLVSSTRFVFNHAMAFRHFGDRTYQDAARHGLRFLQQAHAQPQGGYAWQLTGTASARRCKTPPTTATAWPSCCWRRRMR